MKLKYNILTFFIPFAITTSILLIATNVGITIYVIIFITYFLMFVGFYILINLKSPSLEKYFPKEPQKVIKKHTNMYKIIFKIVVINIPINTAFIIYAEYYRPDLQNYILISVSIIFLVACIVIKEFRFRNDYYYYYVAEAYFKYSINVKGIQKFDIIRKGLICYDKFIRKNLNLRVNDIDELIKRIVIKYENDNSKLLNDVEWKNHVGLINKLKSFCDIPYGILHPISLKNRIWNKETLEILGLFIPIIVAIPSLIDLINYFLSLY